MPITIPTISDQKYKDILQEARTRIPVHTPEWTNHNESDPGITLLELFAFMTENLLYRANLIPKRNRLKFLSLLGIPLKPASPAEGLVEIKNERGLFQTVTLSNGVEVRAGEVPFITTMGLDVLPIEGRVYVKRRLEPQPEDVKTYYRELYASFKGPSATEFELYQSTLVQGGVEPIELSGTVDQSLWIALLLRENDKPSGSPQNFEPLKQGVRQKIAGKTLNIGMVPSLNDDRLRLLPGQAGSGDVRHLLTFEMPKPGALATDRVPTYVAIESRAETDVLLYPGIVQVTLPGESSLTTWTDLDPLEAGVDGFPPALDDTALNNRLVTWIRIKPSTAVQASFEWVGINAVPVRQRTHIAGELLQEGTGEPDQVRILSKRPVIPESVTVMVTRSGEPRRQEQWTLIDDLMNAGPEVPTVDPRVPPGVRTVINPRVNVCVLNPESGELRFGDGTHGARLPFGAIIRVEYDTTVGREGNVNEGAINTSPALPPGLKANNPVRTWGGAEAETVAEGEKQITRFLQHRDRMVTAEDFATLVRRTPGVDINRVEVLPAFNPDLQPNEPGDAPGAVTLMVVPQYDPVQPDAPVPDRLFLDAICRYIHPRRLVTTDVFLRGPVYKDLWVSIGLDVRAGESVATVREAVKRSVALYLSPMASESRSSEEEEALGRVRELTGGRGWPLRKAVVRLEIVTVASRVPGVLLVNEVLVAGADGVTVEQSPMRGLELPRVRVIVAVGPATPIDEILGIGSGQSTTPSPPSFVPIPVIPEECR